MLALKSVKQRYTPTVEIVRLLETFRRIINVCIDIGLCSNVTSLVKSHFQRNDTRIRQKVYSKYGILERNRVQPLLHSASKQIVEIAKARQYGVVMERLTGLRRLYRRGNCQTRQSRARMNSWSYGELQRQIDYKAL